MTSSTASSSSWPSKIVLNDGTWHYVRNHPTIIGAFYVRYDDTNTPILPERLFDALPPSVTPGLSPPPASLIPPISLDRVFPLSRPRWYRRISPLTSGLIGGAFSSFLVLVLDAILR